MGMAEEIVDGTEETGIVDDGPDPCFLNDKQLLSTSNAVKRGNRRFRKMQKTVYRVRTCDHLKERVPLDMFRDSHLLPRCRTIQSLYNAGVG